MRARRSSSSPRSRRAGTRSAFAARPPARRTVCRHRPCWRSSTTTCRSWWTRCWPRSGRAGCRSGCCSTRSSRPGATEAGRLQIDRWTWRRRVERRPPGELHRHPSASLVRGGRSRSRRRRIGDPAGGAGSWWRTGSRCCRPSRRRSGAGAGAGQHSAALAGRVDRLSWNGWSRTTSPSSASREFELVGRRRRRATWCPWKAAGSACCATHGAGAAPRQRAGGDDAGDAPLLLRAFAAHHHQGERDRRVHRRAHMDYIGIKTYRARRHAQGRDPLRRPVHVAGLRAPARARCRSCATRSTRCSAASGYPPASHDGKALLNILDTLPARRAVPDRRRSSCSEWCRASSTWRRGRACACSRASTASTGSSRCCSTCRATATHSTVRERIGALLARDL